MGSRAILVSPITISNWERTTVLAIPKERGKLNSQEESCWCAPVTNGKLFNTKSRSAAGKAQASVARISSKTGKMQGVVSTGSL